MLRRIRDGVKGEVVVRVEPRDRHLLCELWRGRAAAKSPMLRLDESAENAGGKKRTENRRGRERWADEKHKRKER